jgi:hypothetical protein
MATIAKTKRRAKAEPRSRKRKADGPEQYERFRTFAREVGANDDPDAFDRQFRKIVPPKKPLS